MRQVNPCGRYAMFLRKSREDVEAEKAGKFETLAKHRSALERLAESLGIEVSHVYEEIVSGGSLAARADAQRMLEDVRAGLWDGVLAFDLQRVTRGDMIDQGTVVLAFQLSRTLIITPQKVYDLRDELDGNFAEMEMLFGRMELGRITRRLISGKEEAVRQGQYIGSIAPYGYDKVVVDRKKTLTPNGAAQRVVSWFERIAACEATPHSISAEMNAMGIPTPRGKMWDHTLVRRIIQNPVYKGYVRWNNKRTVEVFGPDGEKMKRRQKAEEIVVRGLHEPLVEDNLWQRANDAVAARILSSTPNGYELQDPLASLLVCAACGRSMRRVKNNKNSLMFYQHSPVNKSTCWQRGARMESVVGAVIDALESAAADIDARPAGGKPASANLEAQAHRDLLAEEKSVATLFRLVEKGMISDEEFAERKRLSDGRRAAIEESIERMRADARMAEAGRQVTVNVRRAIGELRSYQGRAAEVNRFLKMIIDRIEYEREPRNGAEIRLRVHLKTPGQPTS